MYHNGDMCTLWYVPFVSGTGLDADAIVFYLVGTLFQDIRRAEKLHHQEDE